MRALVVASQVAALLASASSVAAQSSAEPSYGAVAQVPQGPPEENEAVGRAHSEVQRLQMQERLPRSAPDALRFEPGVSIQQTAHGQASAYVRGLTGQQVVHLFDGVRLNNGLYRQGPNQYFFAVDTYTLQQLQVIRGSASTLYGSDALGGAILAMPRQVLPDPTRRGSLRPRLYGRFTSADREAGGRAEIAATLGRRLGLLTGAGIRQVGQLQGGGVVTNDGQPTPRVPRLAADGRTQLGTGFDEATFDMRLVQQLRPNLQAVYALYSTLQSNAPRTDQCPPPEAPDNECLVYKQQYHTLAYAALRGDLGPAARTFDLTASYQLQQEWRQRDRPSSGVAFDWRDRVHSLGLSARATTRPWTLGRQHRLLLRYGADAQRDGVTSAATQRFTDLQQSFGLTRGQYVDDSFYLALGSYLEAELGLGRFVILRGGGRVGLVAVNAGGDPLSGTQAVHQRHPALVGRAGIEVRPWSSLALLLNVDQGFRAPNLDDLTSRQQTGPGFQFENPNLQAERSTTFELGLRGRWRLATLDAWGFAILLDDAIVRALRGPDDCPPETPQCANSRTQVQLINATGQARVFGTEGGVTLYLPLDFTLRSTLAYARGDSPATTPSGLAAGTRVPLSRIPPLNGSLELRWRHPRSGVYLGGALRWAAAQRRLAPNDLSDARIPVGGTPGYAVLDLRAGWRFVQPRYDLRLALVVENLLDAAYRVHGSSINGAGRGAMLALEAGL